MTLLSGLRLHQRHELLELIRAFGPTFLEVSLHIGHVVPDGCELSFNVAAKDIKLVLHTIVPIVGLLIGG